MKYPTRIQHYIYETLHESWRMGFTYLRCGPHLQDHSLETKRWTTRTRSESILTNGVSYSDTTLLLRNVTWVLEVGIHISTMWITSPGSFSINETLDHPTVLGVHSNEWSILLGYDIIFTKRYMSPGGLASHIYYVGQTARLIQSKRNVGLPTHDWGPF